MARLYTRTKRKLDLTSSMAHKFRGITGKHGAKTFATKETAENHAKNLKLEKYTIVPAKKNKRFKIVSE